MLRNKRFVALLLVVLMASVNVFAQADLTYDLVEKYLTQANDAYDDGDLDKAYKSINGSLLIAKSNGIEFEASLLTLGQSIYQAKLKEIKNNYNDDMMIDIQTNLEKFPEINSSSIRKLVQQIEAQEAQKKELKREAELKKQSEENQKMLDTLKKNTEKSSEQFKDLIDQQQKSSAQMSENMNAIVEANKKNSEDIAANMNAMVEATKKNSEEMAENMTSLMDNQNKVTEAISKSTETSEGLVSGIGKVIILIVVVLVVIVLIVMLIVFIVHSAAKQTRIQQAQYVEAFKMLAANQNQTNQLMLGGITELYNGDNTLKLAGSSRWGTEALPEPESTPEEKEAMRNLATQCEDLGARIDQVTGRKNNSKNVSELVYKIAMNLGLPQHTAMLYFCASMVYDAGFLGIDESLLTAEHLTDEQRKSLQRHVDLAEDYIQFVPKKYWNVFVQASKYHHENMDGSGMPEGLKGDNIPEIARIIRVVDSYIALSSKRAYRGGLDKDSAVEKLTEQPNIYDQDVIKILSAII